MSPWQGGVCTDILYYYYSKKKRGEYDCTSRYDVISCHVTSDVISGEVIFNDVTSGKKKKKLCDENENISKKYGKNDTRKMTSCMQKRSNVAFHTLGFEKVR